MKPMNLAVCQVGGVTTGTIPSDFTASHLDIPSGIYSNKQKLQNS